MDQLKPITAAGIPAALQKAERYRLLNDSVCAESICQDVLAVDPDAQGTGLGSVLTVAGLVHLRDRGVPEAMLYVDSDNTTALRTYQKLGFTHHHTDVEFLLNPGQSGTMTPPNRDIPPR